MPKYWGKQIFAQGRFPEVGQKQKTEKKRGKKGEKTKVGDNNGQATHGTCKLPGPIRMGQFLKLDFDPFL